MNSGRTSAAVQRYLEELAGAQGSAPAEPIVRDLLARSVDRLHFLCSNMLRRSYPRLMRGPVNLQSDEMLGAVVERLIKAMRSIRPQTVRQFFALANQHARWELNDVARRLDERASLREMRDYQFPAPPEPGSVVASPTGARILAAIEGLPEEEREVFNLVRIQGMTQPEAAAVIGCASRTVKRRLDRSLILLAERLGDLRSPPREQP